MTDNKKFAPYVIHGIDPGGVNIITGGHGYGTKGVTLLPGMTIEITEAVRDLNVNRLNESFLDLDDDAQRAKWGKVRWGRGTEIPQSVVDGLEARRLADLKRERDDIIHSGGLRGDGTKVAKLHELNAELAAAEVNS
jgi:hypothetical protein